MGIGHLIDRLLGRSTGARGERVAARHLRGRGYRVLARNYRTPLGEIDLLAEAPDRRTLVVVEVKTGRGGSPELRPELHVNRAKQRKLAALASQLLRNDRLADRPVRFDVVGVDLRPGAPPTIRHQEAAFESYF